jgi:hypothetical protein
MGSRSRYAGGRSARSGPLRLRSGLRLFPAGSSLRPAESCSSPADRKFASGCSPPRLAAAQLPSTTRTEHLLEGDLHPFARACSQAHWERRPAAMFPFPCGSGFPAATIKAERLSHNSQKGSRFTVHGSRGKDAKRPNTKHQTPKYPNTQSPPNSPIISIKFYPSGRMLQSKSFAKNRADILQFFELSFGPAGPRIRAYG